MMSDKGKDSIMKLLLSGATANTIASSYLSINSPTVACQRNEMGEENYCKLSDSLHQLAGYPVSETCVDMDHPYSKPWNWRPENVYAKPMKALFVTAPNSSAPSPEVEIDVVDKPETHSPPYDINKSRSLMEECERHVNILHSDDGDPDWEDHISRLEFNSPISLDVLLMGDTGLPLESGPIVHKVGWTTMQNRIFNKVTRVLHNDYLARLTHKDTWNEPVLRRITVDKTARLLRQILGTVSWDVKYTQWLHTILLDNLDSAYLVVYLEALQTLKSKVPNLVERMLSGNVVQRPINAPPLHETISIVHKRPWDPTTLSHGLFKSRRLPNDPILVMVPSGPGAGFASNSRSHHWMANLSTLSTVICVYAPVGRPGNKVNVSTCLDQMLAATRAKLSEVRTDYGKKPIILVGTNSGAALACQVALVENVAAVVCLGFPLNTVEGKRGQPDDFLLNIQVPVLFVIGQNSSTTTVDDIEELREKMKVETSLVVVGAADDQLRISKTKKKLDGITQSMVDKCILEELGDFLGNLMIAPYPPQPRQPNFHQSSSHSEIVVRKPVKVERKRKLTEMSDNKTTDESIVVRPKKGRKPKVLINQKLAQKWNSNGSQQPVTTSVTIQSDSCTRTSIAQSSNTPIGVNISNLATIHGGHIRTTPDKHPLLEKKGVQISIQGSSIVRQTPESSTITVVASSPAVINPTSINVMPSNKGRLATNQLTSLSSLLQPSSARTSGVLITSTNNSQTEKDGTKSSSTINLDSNLVEELTPDRILELPVYLEDQQIENTETPVKVILSNKPKLGTEAKKLKPAIPAIKYIKKAQQPMKYTKIFLTKKDNASTSGPATVFVEEVIGENGSDGSSPSKPRIRTIPATQHSHQTQFY